MSEIRETQQKEEIEESEPPGKEKPPPTAADKSPAILRTPRPAIWADVPDEKWDDWRWQMANRLNAVGEIAQVINLTPEEIEGLSADDKFRVDVTPYFASLIDPDDPRCPVRRQVIPLGRELKAFDGMMEDSLAEDQHSPVPGLVHRYPDRVLMLVTTQCASYCRYCTRSRIVGDPTQTFSKTDFERQLDYLRKTPQVRDVLLSGGDPLVIAPRQLEYILSSLRAIEHIEIIRIGSRVPIFLPQRITDEFCDMLRKYHPLWMNIHVNHPKEITPELSRALEKLANAGVPLGNQSVLLAGINDSVDIQRELVHKLVRNRVRPYYLYQCDLVEGAGHFRTTVSRGIEIIEGLRGHTSGYAIPTYVVDAPGGGGKIPVMPQYVISQAPGKVVLRNYEGYITTYTEPEDYDPHAIDYLDRQASHRDEPGQRGVAGLLRGDAMSIKPEGFDAIHGTPGLRQQLAESGTAEPRSIERPESANGRLQLDCNSRRVFAGGREIDPPLSLPQYRLLEVLYEHSGQLCTRDMVIEAVWPGAFHDGISEQSLDALVRRLRDRLAETDPDFQYIVTIRGQGFRLENPDQQFARVVSGNSSNEKNGRGRKNGHGKK